MYICLDAKHNKTIMWYLFQKADRYFLSDFCEMLDIPIQIKFQTQQWDN